MLRLNTAGGVASATFFGLNTSYVKVKFAESLQGIDHPCTFKYILC